MTTYKFSITFISPFFLLLISLLLLSCSSFKGDNKAQLNTPAGTPIWFSSRTLIKDDSEYIGYGQGKSTEKAMVRAKSDLALSISSHISYVIEGSIQTNGTTSSKKSQSYSKIESNLQLSNIRLVKTEVINGLTYSAYSYSNLPVVSKIFEAQLKVKCTTHTHPYLSFTPLFLAVKQQLFMNDSNCEPQMQLDYKNNSWFLMLTSTDNKIKMFALGENDFSLLFVRVSNDNLKIKSSSSSLKEGEIYHFNMNVKPLGYLSLIYLSGDGQLLILQNNIWQAGDINSSYPDLNLYGGLAAETNEKRYSQDLVILALCERPIDLSNISKVTVELSDEKNRYQFNQVMQKIKGCRISSEIIKITK